MVRDMVPRNSKQQFGLLPIEFAGAIAALSPAYESYELPKGTIRGSPAIPDDDLTTLRVPFFLVANSKVDTEDALLFVSGYGTNVGVIAQLVGAKDLVICDAAVHNSAVTGSVLSGAARRVFPHNDLDQLEEILGRRAEANSSAC